MVVFNMQQIQQDVEQQMRRLGFDVLELMQEKQALMQRVAELEAELARLRGHGHDIPCPHCGAPLWCPCEGVSGT